MSKYNPIRIKLTAMSTPLAKSSSANDETRSIAANQKLDLILDRYLDDLQNGRACSREELLAQHPDLSDELAEYLDGIEMVSGLGVGGDLIPQRLGDFEIIRPIGRGAMGVVYLANQISLKRPVALKVLRYSVSGKQATARFEREAELVATLQHPNIVPIYATGKHDNHHFLAMQLVDGPSLSQWSAAEDANRDPTTIAKWTAEVARALAHAHQRDVIHRDVKPSNLLQDEDQKIWLTDFGLARRFDDLRMSMTGAMLGTPNYMSPEQASPARYPIDHRTDVYSLGATLFELLTGRCVFLAETPHAVLAQVLAEEAPPLREIQPDASRDLETILIKCLEKEPSDRYQTAEQLADDLEAFTEGRSIKARRPGIIEQAGRWKRTNQKAVSWALTAATAAAVLIAVSVASWIGWNNSQLGGLTLQSDEGPIAGRLINANGEPTSTFTIPTRQPMPVKEGHYTLQVWDGGKLGGNQDIFVNRRQQTWVNSVLPDNGVFPERTVQGIPAVLPLGDRDDLVFFHKQGITRVDGRTGSDLWTAEAKNFLKPVNATAEIKNENQQDNNPQQIDSVPIKWLDFAELHNYDDRRLPVVAQDFPDINQDGEREVMIASHTEPVLFAFDGKSGELLWHYVASPTVDDGTPYEHAGSLHRPRNIGDIDGDGVHDFATNFFSRATQVHQWTDAVSGKTGQRIWRLELPEKWFNKGTHNVSAFCQLDPSIHNPFRHAMCYGRYRVGVGNQNQPNAFVIPWPCISIPAKQESETDLLLHVCGTKLIVCDAKTGQASDFNQGDPVELGFIPALAPKLIPLGEEPDCPMGVLLCEQVSLADCNTVTKPVTRFSLWSLETGSELWHFDAACDPGWTGVAPDWPLLLDLTGDCVPEILIADGADLEKVPSTNATCLASMRALDARTGKSVWQTEDVARIRNLDRQVQRVLIGPDADGDDREDLYVVSPMQGEEAAGGWSNSWHFGSKWVFVDILSSVTGKLIRSTKSEASVFKGPSNDTDFEEPFFLGVGSDGYPRLVVTTKNNRGPNRQSTIILSTGTGRVTHLADQLEHPLQADGDGDGNLDLFLIKSRKRSKLLESGQLISFNANGGRGKKMAGWFSMSDDVDGDGVRDLTSATPQDKDWQAFSGATGERLWKWAYSPANKNVFPLNKDVDGDNVNDFLVATCSQSSWDEPLLASLISGHEGRMLWQQEWAIDAGLEQSGVKCDDMNGDGVNDIVLVHQFSKEVLGSGNSGLRVSCFDGMSGDEHWHCDLAAVGSPAGNFRVGMIPIHLIDIDDNGSQDVFCRSFGLDGTSQLAAIDGDSGEFLWKHALNEAIIFGASRIPSWRAAVLATGPDHKKQIATAMAHEHVANAVSIVKVTFYDVANERPISTWSDVGSFKSHDWKNPPALGNGIPFEIVAGEKGYTGVCIQTQSAGKLQIVVLDSHQAEAMEVQRVDIPLPNKCPGKCCVSGAVLDRRCESGRTH